MSLVFFDFRRSGPDSDCLVKISESIISRQSREYNYIRKQMENVGLTESDCRDSDTPRANDRADVLRIG